MGAWLKNLAQRARWLWRRATTARYARALEGEVARLRAENRALLNSILGIAGIPPVLVNESGAIATGPEGNPPWMPEQATANVADKGSSERGGFGKSQKAAPTRGRSWRQICRVLESEALKTMQRHTDNGAEIAVPTRRTQK